MGPSCPFIYTVAAPSNRTLTRSLNTSCRSNVRISFSSHRYCLSPYYHNPSNPILATLHLFQIYRPPIARRHDLLISKQSMLYILCRKPHLISSSRRLRKTFVRQAGPRGCGYGAGTLHKLKCLSISENDRCSSNSCLKKSLLGDRPS